MKVLKKLIRRKSKSKGDYIFKPISLHGKLSEQYVEYKSKILRYKWGEEGPVANAWLQYLAKRITSDPNLSNRERAKLQQAIVEARTYVTKFPNVKARHSVAAMLWTPKRRDIFRAYGIEAGYKKKVKSVLSKILGK